MAGFSGTVRLLVLGGLIATLSLSFQARAEEARSGSGKRAGIASPAASPVSRGREAAGAAGSPAVRTGVPTPGIFAVRPTALRHRRGGSPSTASTSRPARRSRSAARPPPASRSPIRREIDAVAPALTPGSVNDVVVGVPGKPAVMLKAAWFAWFLDVPPSHLFARADRAPAADGHHDRLRRGEILPRRLGDPRPDGGLHPARQARLELSPAARHRNGFRRRPEDCPLRGMDGGVRGRGHHDGLRRQEATARTIRDARRDGGLPSPCPPRELARAASRRRERSPM